MTVINQSTLLLRTFPESLPSFSFQHDCVSSLWNRKGTGFTAVAQPLCDHLTMFLKQCELSINVYTMIIQKQRQACTRWNLKLDDGCLFI
jgi:hypothetical protein